MLNALLFILFLGILIITHEFGHFITAKWFRLRVDEFAFGFPPKLFSKKKGDTTYSINAVPFGGFVKIYGESEEGADPNEDPKRSFYIQPAWKRAIIIGAGVVMNFLVGWLAFSIFIFFIGIPQSVYISEVIPNSPAEMAGFKSGEKLEGYKNSSEFIYYVNENAGKEIEINGRLVTPRENPPPEEGKLGIRLKEGDFAGQHNPFQSLVLGFTESVNLVKQIFIALGNIFAGIFAGENVLKSLTGPVGIYQEVGKAADYGILSLVSFLGVLSLNLAVFNLLPIPALDGGRLFFILIETVIGRRLNVKYEIIANTIGFGLLILLAIIITFNDILR